MTLIDTATRVRVRAEAPAPVSNDRSGAYLALTVVAAYHFAALVLIAGGLSLTLAAIVGDPTGIRAVELLPAALAALVLLTLRQYGTGFSVPGPRLMRGADDGLFALVDEIAVETGTLPFHEFYLGPGADVTVYQRDDRFGLGGRRTLVIGFALTRVLTREELRALVIHSHARYFGGSRFGAYVERRRLAMQRGLRELDGRGSAITALPFLAYSKFFLTTSAAVSRRQVIDADAEAAVVAGPEAMAGALRALVGTPAVLDAYLHVWARGDRRPLADYLRKYESRDRMAMAVHYRTRVVPADSAEVPLGDRLGRLDRMEPAEGIVLDEPAAQLFCELDEREHPLTVAVARQRGLV